MTDDQFFLPPRGGVDGEQKLKNSISPKILECLAVFLLTPPNFAFPRAQSSQELNLPVR